MYVFILSYCKHIEIFNAPTTLCYIIIILLITVHSTIILQKLYLYSYQAPEKDS